MTRGGTDTDLDKSAAYEPVNRRLGVWQIVAGSLGLLAAFVLTVEKIHKIADPSYVPSCSINPILSCGTIMDSHQAAAFGFPNPIIGLMAFPVVIVTGVLRTAGLRLPRWYAVGFAVGTLVGLLFVHWLIVVSLYQVHALCPYCLVVWVVMIPLSWYTILDTWRRQLEVLARWHSTVLALWYVIIAAAVFLEFRDYWVSLF